MAEPPPLVALGVLSSFGASGQASAAQYLGRRTSLRDGSRRFAQVGLNVRLTFLIATPPALTNRAALGDEQREHRDIFVLPMNESRFNCALKPLIWFAHCAIAFPQTHFYAIADDDTYLQLAHLEADVRSLLPMDDGALVLYGLVMWYAMYDNVTMVPHEAWGGWLPTDAMAVKLRRRIERCRDARGRALSSSHSARDPCTRMASASRETIARNGLADDVPPWPVVNGPLFAVSRSLARLLVDDPYPRTYLERLHGTARVRAALSRRNGPRKSNFGCWPVYDTVLGLWVTQIAKARNVAVRLVNMPVTRLHRSNP